MTVTVSVNDVIANVLKKLKGEPLEMGLAHLIKDYTETRIRECDGKGRLRNTSLSMSVLKSWRVKY